MDPTRRIIVPLDLPTAPEALAFVDRLRGRVGMFKVGLQLFTSAGPGIVREIVRSGEEVFLDLKFHDIPNTVAQATAAAASLGASFIDVHLAGGARMIRAAVEAARTTPGIARPPRLLGITVLTSLEENDLDAVGMRGPLSERVVSLARLGQDAGLDGVVASPHEIASIKKACGPSFIVVTPGIRPTGAAHQDQRRVMTPALALSAGADYLVIGRPIMEAPDPAAAVESIAQEMR